MLVLLLGLLAQAQTTDSGFDARGPTIAGSDADVRDPIVSWRPERQDPGAVSLQALAEIADDPFVVYTLDQDVLTREAMIDALYGVNLAGHVAAHERVAISATMPVWFASQSDILDGAATIGDLRMAAPIGVVMPDAYEGGFGLSLVPFMDLPTGNQGRYLGQAGVSGGALAAVGISGRRWELDGNLGFQGTPAVTYNTVDDGRWNNLTGGRQLLASAAGAIQLGEQHAIRAETYYRASLTESAVQNSQSPGEALLSVRGRYEQGLSWTAGAGTGLNGAAGAARLRVFAGLGYVYGKPLPKPLIAWLDVLVVDRDGTPIPTAMVSLDLDSEEVDDKGHILFADLEPGSTVSIAAEATGYTREHTMVDVLQGENQARLVLAPTNGVLTVTVNLQTGEPVDAQIVLMGPKQGNAGNLGEDGTRVWTLPPGDYTAIATAPDLPIGQGTATVPPGGRGRIELVLERPKVEIVAKEIVLPEKVHFEFDTAILVDDSVPVLAEVARVLLNNPELTMVEIAGHTDLRGSAEYNRDLAQRRTQTVRDFLVARGVAAERLVPKGYGESDPLTTGQTEEDHAMNRRVQFFIVEQTEGEGEPGAEQPGE